MLDIIFEDPPERDTRHRYNNRKNLNRERVLAELRENAPDRWAVVSRHNSRARSAQTARELRTRHPDNFEFRAATSQLWGEVVYGRYVPGKVKLG